MTLIIDCHGHYTTAPKALEDWRNQQIAGIKDASVMPRASDLRIRKQQKELINLLQRSAAFEGLDTSMSPTTVSTAAENSNW